MVNKHFHLHWHASPIKTNLHLVLLGLFLLSIPFSAWAQNRVINGKVTSADDGSALIGVNVSVKEAPSVGTATDINGAFSLTVPSEGTTLVFSFVGFTNKEEIIGTRTLVEVSLSSDVALIDQVVVVGYGAQRKSDLTGSVAVVKSTELKKYATNDVAQLLQGRAAGVAVTSDGQPGAFPSVRIRGIGTFGNGEPLYVIDGVPVGTTPRDFNPNDVESIQVLKDASAGAIYGSRAANGVVIITTKQGRKNAPLKVEYSGYYGSDKVWQRIPVTNRANYQLLNNESQTNGGQTLAPGNDPNSPLFIQNIDTDWQKEGIKTGSRQNHNLNFSGGSSYMTYNFSLDYFGNQGTFVGNGPTYDRYSARINTEAEKGIFKVGQSLYYTHSHENLLTYVPDLAGNRPPLVGDLLIAIPTMPVLDPKRKGGFGGTSSAIERAIVLNSIGLNSLIDNFADVDRMFGVVYGELKLLRNNGHNLKYKVNLSYDRTLTRDYAFQPAFDLGFFFQKDVPRLNDGSRTFTTSLVENTLNYEKTFGKHSIAILAGQMFQVGSFLGRNGYSERFTEPYYPVLDNGTNKTAAGSESKNVLASYLGRFNYSYDDRYLLTATLRRDGSSRFAPSNRYGNFPSLAVAWKLHNEDFLNLPEAISEFKIRASYGQLGNQEIGNYAYFATINPNITYSFGGNKVTGATQTQLVSEDIRWETKTTSNVGFDAAFFNNKFSLSAEYYNSKTTDILVGVPIPESTGANNTPTVNAGSLRNSGVEVVATYRKYTGALNFEISANITTLQNEVLALGGNEEPIYGAGAITEVGSEIGQHYGWLVDGIFQTQAQVQEHAFQNARTAPGDLIFRDINGDNIVNAEDRTYLGSALPSLYYGLNFTASYKNFDFTLFASGAAGYLINGRNYRELMHTQDYINYHEDALNRWTPTNTNTNIPRLVAGDPNDNMRDSNREGWLQDGTHLRINTLSLGYKLPENLIKGITSARVYVTAQNVYSFQQYKGFNPDFTASILSPGFDFGSFPKPRTLMFGVQAAF